MQVNEIDFRKIIESIKEAERCINLLEESVAYFQKKLEDYDKSYGQSIQEWLESIDASKQKDTEE